MGLNTLKVKLPDGNAVAIREANGEDEGILSSLDHTKSGTAIPNYLASLIIGGTSVSEILRWKVNSQNFLLIQARILTYGHELKFSHICGNSDCDLHKRQIPAEVTEDLRRWGWEPEEGDPLKAELKPGKFIKEYPTGTELYMEKDLSSGKRIQLKTLTGETQAKIMAIPESELNTNSDILCRELKIWGTGTWDSMLSLKSLTGRDMMEIRKLIKDNEPPMDMNLELQCTSCKKKENLNLISLPDFFFPMA